MGAYTSLGSPLDPFAATNPYAVAPQSVWQAPARSRTELTFGNVFAIAFENMFPSCLFTVVHSVVATCAGLLLLGFALAMLYLFAGLKLGPQAMIGATIVLFALIAPVGVAVGAWFSSSIRHMALLAVRGRAFDGSQALSPGGAYNVGLLIAFINMILQLVTRAPQLIERLAPGTVGVFALPWALVVFVLTISFTLATSLAWFAAIDGDNVGDALSTSFRLVFSNFLVMIGVKLVVWMITIVLLLPTLGLALALPIYFNAALYHLARSSE